MNYCYFENRGFKLIEIYKFNHRFSSYVYEYNNDIIIIDDNFDKSNVHFLYSTYCEMQNRYMYQYDRVLRFHNLNDDENTYNKILDLRSPR